MKKQYRYIDIGRFKFRFSLYHDGELIDNYDVWLNELEEEINKIESLGYEYGYAAYEIQNAKEKYEYMLERAIER